MGNPGTKSQTTESRDEGTSRDRLSDATSEKTVSDLEENEKSTGAKSDTSSSSPSVPAPDGTPNLDRSGGRADGSDTGGPM